MVRIYYREGKQIKRETDVREIGHLKGILWIDLQSPSQEEEEWVETKCDISFQTPQEIVEIESSSRYFEQNNTINANSNFLKINTDGYAIYPVSIMIRGGMLFTYRNGDSKTFADTVRKMKVSQETFQSGVDMLLLLLETRIESDADVLEMAENLSTGVPFATPVFDGASEDEIRAMLKLAYPDEVVKRKGLTQARTQAHLFDGRTGDPFERPTTIGYMHFLKLHHLLLQLFPLLLGSGWLKNRLLLEKVFLELLKLILLR